MGKRVQAETGSTHPMLFIPAKHGNKEDQEKSSPIEHTSKH